MGKVLKIKTFVVGPLETNCYLVFDDSGSAVLIDPGFYDDGPARFIKKEKLNLNYIINTHGHPDHIGANKRFEAPVLIHELDMHLLKGPASVLKDKDRMRVGGLDFEVIHTPGHTPGSICLKTGKILFTGDTLFCEGVGRTDLANGNGNALMNSIRKKIMDLADDTIVYPGHGPSTTIGHERRFNPFL